MTMRAARLDTPIFAAHTTRMDFQSWAARAATFTHDGESQSYTDVGPRGAPVVLLLHGYPTWSYDWVDVVAGLEADHRVIAPDWLGYGLSDKPARHVEVGEQIDRLHALLAMLGVESFHLVAHDYGATCAQELLDRPEFAARIDTLTLLNGGLVYDAYRPTLTQRLLVSPLGPLLSRLLGRSAIRRKLDAVRGVPLTDRQFDALWAGMEAGGGMGLMHVRQRYIPERARHGARWQGALWNFGGPVQLVWGPEDPVSGAHVLAPLRERMPGARVVELPGIGHFVPDEAPDAVVEAVRSFVAGRPA